MEKPIRSLEMKNLSRSRVSESIKRPNEQGGEFCSRVCCMKDPVIGGSDSYLRVNEQGHRDILAVEPMLDELEERRSQLFQSLLNYCLKPPLGAVSDANNGLIAAIRESFSGAF